MGDSIHCCWCDGTGDGDREEGWLAPACSWCEGSGKIHDPQRLIREIAADDPDSVQYLLAHVAKHYGSLWDELNALHESLAWQEDPWGQRHGAMNCRRCGTHCTQAEVSNTYDADYHGEESGYVAWFCCADCTRELDKDVA